MADPPKRDSAVPPPGKPPDDRLDSWKDIAAHLKRDVSTVQRWEKKEGMPVHRHFHDELGSVYASRAELDAWSRSRSPSQTAGDSGGTAAESDPPVASAPPPGPSGRRRLVWLALACGILAGLGAAVWFVRGTEAHHYRGTLSLERVIEQQPPEVQAQLRADLEEAEVKELPFDVWIGDDGLARRLKMGDWNEASQPPATMDFYDFGIPVDIEPPAADEVLTADELMKLIDGQMGTEGCSGFSDPKTAGNQPRYEHCREWTASHLGGTPAGEANK